MSDSDSELLANNVFTFRNESTIVSARGPTINTSNLTGLSFRNNVLTSTMNMPKNFEYPRRAASNFDQRSIGFRRETSPMSMASACDVRQRHFNNSYAKGMSSQRSMYNGRGGSPMSMRSIDSNATVSAADIAMALKNTQFNKYESRIIQEACNKFMKHKTRKRIEKRRNLRLFLKGYRRKSGNDSGELGSNSSISSDDERSTRTFNYRKNMSSCRSTKTDVSDFRRTIKESNMFNDCTNKFRQNKVLSMVGGPANLNTSRSSVTSFRSMITKPTGPISIPPPPNFNKTLSQSSMTQRDRFKNGFLLPSQRFNRSVAATSIQETVEKPHYSEIHRQHVSNREHDIPAKSPQEINSGDEEIFSEITTIEKPTKNHRKRNSDDDICLPNHKRPKVASPCKNLLKSLNSSSAIEKTKNDFEFVKPVFPVRKSANLKAMEKIISTSANTNPTEKLISKSSLPKQSNPQPKVNHDKYQIDSEDITEISQNTTDLSMRPSFIKRKLFTQTMDVTEKTNDVLAANSPQNSIYGAIQKEKNKARKLVTSQYCLSRDIHTDENNLLDLIHKIVPAERMNATNQTNKTVAQSIQSEDNDHWDVTSIISTRNNDDDMSDTFTDEDTVNANSGKIPSPKVTAKKLEKSPPKVTKATKKVLVEKNGTPNKTVQKYVKSFWDTDFESDAECTPASRKPELKENKRTEKTLQTAAPNVKYQGFSSMFPANNTKLANNASVMNSTVDSVQRFNNTNRSFKLCSHRNNKPNPKTVPERIKEVAKSHIEPLNMKQKTIKPSSCIDLSMQENSTEPCNKITKKQESPKTKKTKKSPSKNPRSNKEKDETPKEAKQKETKKPSSKQNKTLKSDEKTRHQNNKTETAPSKGKKKLNAPDKTLNNKKSDANNKPHKSETSKNQIQGDNFFSKNSKNEKTNCKQVDTIQLDTTVSNNKKNNQLLSSKKTNISNLLDPIVYEGSFTETNNNSLRSVRSCRVSKQNETLDTNRANRTLRSREASLKVKANQNKTLNNKKSDANNKPHKSDTPKNQIQGNNFFNKNSKNEKTNCKQVDSIQLDTTVSNNKKNNKLLSTKKTDISKLLDPIVYEGSFTETNNNSLRPVRSCRVSKQNETLDTNRANRTQTRSLRSREASFNKNPENNKPAAKYTNTTKARNESTPLSDLSFSIPQDKKPFSSITRLYKAKDIDTSVVSFSLTNDKDSPLPKRVKGNSAYSRNNSKQLALFITPLSKNSIHSYKSQSKNNLRSVRNRLANRRYVS